MANVYVLRECNTILPSIYTNTTLTPGISGYLGQVVQLAGYPDNCWIVIQETGTATPESVTILGAYPDCSTCQTAGPPAPIIYRLSDCKKILPFLYTNNVLTPGVASSSVIYILEYPDTCWSVVAYPTGSPVAFTLINAYEKCEACVTAIPEPPINVFKLTNCTNAEQTISSFTSSLVNVLGKVINIENYAGICWSVSVEEYLSQATQDVAIATNEANVPQIFDNCECCLPIPEPAPIKYTRVIPKPDRKFYQITQGQCDITANIRFADGYYRLFKQLKYGISNQCDGINLERLWIRKNLSDLAVINDPTACIITTPVKPDVCLEPSGNPYVPPVPPETYTFTVGAYGIDPGTFGCTTCLDGSAPVGGSNLCPQFNLVLDYNILDTLDFYSAYVFNYNGNCLWAIGFTIVAGFDPNFQTYTMTSANITSIVLENGVLPCLLCGG